MIADDVMQIIDSVPAQSEEIQKAKLRAEYRLKLLAKWNPKKYGEKQTHEIGNKEGETFKADSVDSVALTQALAEALRNQKVGK